MLIPEVMSQTNNHSIMTTSRQNHASPVKLATVAKRKVDCNSVAIAGTTNTADISITYKTVRFQELQEVMQKTTSDAVVMIKSRPKKHLMRTERGSKYRGVSKNGKKWQVSALTVFTAIGTALV